MEYPQVEYPHAEIPVEHTHLEHPMVHTPVPHGYEAHEVPAAEHVHTLAPTMAPSAEPHPWSAEIEEFYVKGKGLGTEVWQRPPEEHLMAQPHVMAHPQVPHTHVVHP